MQQQQQQQEQQQIFGRQTADVFHVGAKIWVPRRSVRRQSSRSDGVLAAASNAIFRNTALRDWVAGVVKRVDVGEVEGVILTVEIAESKQLVRIDTEGCYLQNEEDVADLVDSDFLHEPGVLSTLKVRYQKAEIYTFSGTILIAVNPHKPCPHLYTQQQMNLYHSKTLGEQPPHVYAIAEHAFQSMLIENQRQAILISGESGAGKTESAKMVMQYLAHRAKQDNGFIKNGECGRMHNNGSFQGARPIEEQVLESNPLLEAFGNAKTMRNNNSSRFGKFVEMSFGDYGFVRGASIAVFLLERSRVVSINPPERSYHIFYQLTKGATQHQQQKYRLKPPEQFRYLAQSNSFSLGDRDDVEEFRKTMEAMRIVGLTELEQDSVLRIVAAILHLGDVTFSAEDQDSQTHLANEQAEQAARNCADLLEVDVELLKKGLLSRSIDTPHGRIHKPLNKFGAEESRDAFSKTLYSQLFEWLVGAINRKIQMLGSGERRPHTIGILDIYGFESFESNSFEQLCINLANERLQQQFNHHVLQGEQQQYINEGIKWSYVEFIDNQDCLDLLEGSKSNPRQGIFPLIDEACRLPNVTNSDLAISMRTQLKNMTRFESPKRDQSAFTIDHYAGQVHYTTDQLIEKNRDYIVEEHKSIITSSANELIRKLGFQQIGGNQNAELNKRALQRSNSSRSAQSAFKLTSVGYRFRRQLQDLSDTLSECQPLYIRCIKPNPQSQPGEFVFPFVLGQLHALGVLVAVRIACAGFPTRKTYSTFVKRYYMLARQQTKLKNINQNDFNECKTCTVKILQHMEIEGFQMGKTKLFLRAGQLAILEAARGRLLNISATRIQACCKRHQAVKRYQLVKHYIVVIQCCYRGFKGRQLAQQIRKERAALTIQSCYKGYVARQKYRRIISAVRIQRAFRRYQTNFCLAIISGQQTCDFFFQL
uniref:Myosin n=1 Tax=Acetabularia peniculus TaxID=35862 RepID=O04145_ACEPE|nr:myosin [Acetabularia peniculus]